MAKIQKIFNISFVLNKKVLILFNTMDKMNKKRQGSICHDEQVAYRPLIIWRYS